MRKIRGMNNLIGTKMKNTNAHLPLDKFHIVKITELSPEEIKTSAETTKRDREKIKHTTLLNAIVKALGFKGGFSEYKQFHYKNLERFLKENNLLKRADLFSLREKGYDSFPELKSQDLSERFFYSGLDIPKKVFTGYDYDYKFRMEDGNLGLLTSNGFPKLPHALPVKCRKREDVEKHLNIARKFPNEKVTVEKRFKNRNLIDVVLGIFYFNDFNSGFNLLGDSLTAPITNNFEVTLYPGSLDKKNFLEEKELLLSKCKLFRERIGQGDEGWVEVIPFNDKLIFIKGRNGEYDFLFKNQRDKSFDHQIYGNSLKRSDIPSFIEDYNFARWHYFEYKGWRERDFHEAENLHYRAIKKGIDYPGIDVLLKKYYVKTGVFKQGIKKVSDEHPDYFPVKAKGKQLMVSNLFSIDDFSDFLNERVDYLKYREGKSLATVNNEDDYSLPVGTTFFDTLAFIKWYEDKTNLPVRLLKYEEFLEIRGEESLLDPQDILLVDKFQKNNCRFNRPLKWYEREGGLKFIQSNNFGEWLFEKTCIRTGSLLDFRTNNNVIQDRPQPYSLGAYKGLKIGFRLCYELDTSTSKCGGIK